MISFISGTLLKEEHSCKFMLKHVSRNCFRQFTKPLTFKPFASSYYSTHRLGNV